MQFRTVGVVLFGAGVISLSISLSILHVAGGEAPKRLIAERPATSPIAFTRAELTQRPVVAGFIDQATLKRRASFRSSRGDTFEVHEGLLLPKFAPRQRGEPSQSGTDLPLTCVILSGGGYSTASCDDSPFVDSTLLFNEAASGGPDPEARTEFQLSGLASPRVARIEALDSNGRIRSVQLKSGAFFIELSRKELAAGISNATLRVYDASGALIETVDA